MLTANDLRAGLGVVQQLAAVRGSNDFARRGVELLGRLVASELTTLSVCDLASGHRRVIGSPAGTIGAAERAAFDRHFSEHPLVRHHAAGRDRDAHRISDSVPFSRFRHSALYCDYYRRIGIDHAIAVPLHVDDRLLVSFVLNRQRRDFSDRERAQLDLLTPSLGELYRHTLALDRARTLGRGISGLLAAADLGVIRVEPDGAVCDFSPRAAELALRLCGQRLQRHAPLPEVLSLRLEQPLRCSPPGSAGAQRQQVTHPSRLTVRTWPEVDPEGGLIVLLEESEQLSQKPASLPRLSPREHEVMRWVAAGKTDRDIGAILGISPRTVHKHLQRAYTKLGVETRTAAALRWLGRR